MASTAFSSSVSSTTNKLFDSSFHGVPMSPSLLRFRPIKSSHPNNLSISASASPSYDLNTFKFDPIKESIVSREMTRRYTHARTMFKFCSNVILWKHLKFKSTFWFVGT